MVKSEFVPTPEEENIKHELDIEQGTILQDRAKDRKEFRVEKVGLEVKLIPLSEDDGQPMYFDSRRFTDQSRFVRA